MISRLISWRYYLALVSFSVLVLLKLHGSSLPLWDSIIMEKINTSQNSLLLGIPREVRSDEWLVQTPMYLSQGAGRNSFPVINPLIRSDGQNMLLSYYAPVKDITLVGKPFNWGFVIFGGEYGLSWYWWSKLILLLLLSYELCSFLSGGDTMISCVGALWIAFSPAVQWWFSTAVVDYLIFSQAIIITVLNYGKTGGRWVRLLFALLLACSIIGFTLTAYAPVMIPIGILTLIFLVFIIRSARGKARFGPYDIILLVGVLFLVGSALYSYLYKSYNALQIVKQTVYPGRRFITGGHFDLSFLELSLINWLFPFRNITFSNNCEMSTYLNLFPAVLLAFFAVRRVDTRLKGLMTSLFVYILFQLSWLTFSYPAWFAKYSLFSYVTEERLQLTMSLSALYMSIWAFSLFSRHSPLNRFTAAFVALGTTVFSYFLFLTFPMRTYLGQVPGAIIATMAFFFILNLAFLGGMKKLFLSCIIIFITVGGLTVNPLSRGLGPIYNKVITEKILMLNAKDPDKKWMSHNNLYLGNYLISLGIRSFNSVHCYPDLNMWKLLDPDGTFLDVYNRYAHVQVQLTDKPTKFYLAQTDYFVLFLNLYDLKKTGVKYILSKGKLLTSMLREVDRVSGDDLFIYEVL